MGTKHDIGAKGERIAAEWLVQNGFELLHCNWRTKGSELDIIAKSGDNIHFIEVKTRRRGSLTSAQEAMSESKFRAMMVGAQRYIELYNIKLEPQFDLISIIYTETSFDVEYTPCALNCRW